jgi:hypothetical protein
MRRAHLLFQVLKRAAVQTDAAVAAAQLLQLESLCGPFDCFVEARKRFAASTRAASAAARAPTATAVKGAKTVDEDLSAPSAKRPRTSSLAEPSAAAASAAAAAAAPRKESSQRPPPATGESAGGEELTLHVRHAFEIRELSLRKL